MSSRIRSGGSRRAADSANWPPGTGRTLYPRSLSMPASTWRLAGVSSTTRMPAGRPARALALSGFNGRPRAEEVKEGLVLEAFGQAAEAPGPAGVAGLALPDRRQQPVQVGRDDGVPHGPDKVVRPTRERLGGEPGRLLRGHGRDVLGVVVFHPRVGVDLFKQVSVPEWLAQEIVRTDRQQLLAVLVHRTGRHGDDLGGLAADRGPDAADRLDAVHDRHAEVHQDQVGPPFLELLHGLRPVGRQPGLEPDRGEQLGQQLAVVLDVVGDEYPARGLAGPEAQDVPGLVFRLDRPGLPLLQRQVDGERAALADLA